LLWIKEVGFDGFASHISESRTLTPPHLEFAILTFLEYLNTSLYIENCNESEIEYQNEKYLEEKVCEETFV
jgi:hypothetical protein